MRAAYLGVVLVGDLALVAPPHLSYLPMNLTYLVNGLCEICPNPLEKMGVADIKKALAKCNPRQETKL